MTDRHRGYIVTLDHDLREDDAEEGVIVALRMVRGVIDVQPITADANCVPTMMRERDRWRRAFAKVIENIDFENEQDWRR